MSNYRVDYETMVSCTVSVQIEDDDSRLIDNGGDWSPEDLALELAYDELPGSLCISCSGYGLGSNYSLDMGGTWEPIEPSPVERVDAD